MGLVAGGRVLVLRGGLFELGRHIKALDHRLTSRSDLEIAHAPEHWVDAVLAGFRVSLFNPNVAPVRRMLEEWIAWVRRAEIPGLDFVDRFYLEQRVGCWLGDIEQALDLVQPEKLHVANSARTLSLLLSQPLEVRQEYGHQVRLIEALSPRNLRRFPTTHPIRYCRLPPGARGGFQASSGPGLEQARRRERLCSAVLQFRALLLVRWSPRSSAAQAPRECAGQALGSSHRRGFRVDEDRQGPTARGSVVMWAISNPTEVAKS